MCKENGVGVKTGEIQVEMLCTSAKVHVATEMYHINAEEMRKRLGNVIKFEFFGNNWHSLRFFPYIFLH